MKNYKNYLAGLLLMIGIPIELLAQNGMDYSGPLFQRYASLRESGGGFFGPILNNEKALAVYNSQTLLPSSQLEVNSTTNYTPFLHPNLGGDRGLVFRSVAPSGFTQQWEMYRDNTLLMGRLFNLNGTDDYTLEASSGNLNFNSGGFNARMRILGSNGFTGIGDYNTFVPLSLLHLDGVSTNTGELFRTTGVAATQNFWRLLTDNSEKFSVFTTLNAGVANGQRISDQNITLQATQRDMIFNAGGNIERMRILGQDHNLQGISPWFATARAGNVGISNEHPLTRLHIGGNGAAGAGWRPWMDIGTYYASEGGFDNMYVGLRELANDRNEAIINFGNNPSSNPQNGDLLRFVFTGAPGNGLASGLNGFEIARMWADGQDNGRMGIGDFFTPGLDPQNTLEIRASAGSPFWGQPGGASGLRFTFLTSNDQTIVNPGDGVLSVDENGDVIYVDMPPVPTGGIGNLCTDPQNPITGNYEIPLDAFNFYFTDPAGPLNQDENRVVIGQDCNALTPAKLNVYRDLTTNTPFEVIGAQVINADIANSNPFLGISTGVLGVADGQNRQNFGIRGLGDNGSTNYGGRFNAPTLFDGVQTGFQNFGIQAFASNGNENIGVDGIGSGGNFNYGVRGQAFGVGALNYGVYGSAGPSSGVTPPTGPNYAGFFDGDVVRTGTDNFTSDGTLKSNVQNIGNALQIVNQLNPVNFEFNQNIHPQMHLANGAQYGFIAQDVEQVLPELVKDEVFPPQFDSLGNVITQQVDFKSLNYQAFIPILTKGMQEQQFTIDSLGNELAAKDSLINDINDRLTQLENCLSNLMPALCQINNSAIQQNDDEAQEVLLNQINVELFDGENIILEQNIPNPFAERTVINYQIPASVGAAKLLFYNNEGRMIREVNINERGAGQVNVFGAELSKGTYSYTLVCDEKVIATKKMVKQ